MVVQLCSVHSTQSVNTEGALAANKSARAMLGPPDTALLHMCGTPLPGVANRPSSGACCVGPGHGQSGARRSGNRGQRRVTYQRTRLIKPPLQGPPLRIRTRHGGREVMNSAICGGPKMADFAASAGMELFHRLWILFSNCRVRLNSVRLFSNELC